MTSRLVKAVRKVFRLKPRPYHMVRNCQREGHAYCFNHRSYGTIKVLAEDRAISWYVLDGQRVWESDLVKVFEREIQPGKDVLDVGANLGLHTILFSKHLAQMGKGGVVFAFEPHPEIFPLTEYNCAARANITCIHKAASDRAGILHMPSILKTPNAGGYSVITDSGENLLPVEACTIDSLELANVGFLKIDVECHEMSCIEGAKETIRRCRPTMVIEVCGGYSLQTSPPEIVAEIKRRIGVICQLGYGAEQISEHDYLFRPL